MARLPQPGGDKGAWGSILNDYLSQAHNVDGSLKDDIVTTANLAPNAVDETVLGVTAGTNGQVLSKDTGSSTGLSWVTVSGGVVSDASPSVKGLVQLTGDLGGTATAPTVPGLTAKATDSAVVHNTGAETIAGVKTFSSSPLVPTPTLAGQATNKSYVDGVVGSVTPDASATEKGIVQLTGDLGGTATAPTVVKVNGISVTGTPSSGQVLKATSTTAATWQTDATGGGSAWNFTSLSSNTTLGGGDYALVDTTGAGVTITLPTAANGASVRVKRISGGANSVQIVPQAPALIDGSGVGSHVLGNQWDSMEFVSDGTNWYRG